MLEIEQRVYQSSSCWGQLISPIIITLITFKYETKDFFLCALEMPIWLEGLIKMVKDNKVLLHLFQTDFIWGSNNKTSKKTKQNKQHFIIIRDMWFFLNLKLKMSTLIASVDVSWQKNCWVYYWARKSTLVWRGLRSLVWW